MVVSQAAEFASWTGESQTDDDAFEINDLNDPIPEGLPEPATHRMFIMPVGLKRKTKGGIIIPEEAIDAQKWLNAIGRIARIGAGCFKHPRYKELGLVRTLDFPTCGDLVLYSAHAPLRFQFRGTRIIVVNDDQWFARIDDESTVGSYQFYI